MCIKWLTCPIQINKRFKLALIEKEKKGKPSSEPLDGSERSEKLHYIEGIKMDGIQV